MCSSSCLSNRVNPTRENRRITSVRTALADSVMAVMGHTSVCAPALVNRCAAGTKAFLKGLTPVPMFVSRHSVRPFLEEVFREHHSAA